MKTLKLLVLTSVLILLGLSNLQAQKVTFQINMKPMIEDKSFNMSEHFILISGNLGPIKNEKIRLTDGSPADSVFTATISFPGYTLNKDLTYTYSIQKGDEYINETRPPRGIKLKSGEQEVDMTYFNTFSW